MKLFPQERVMTYSGKVKDFLVYLEDVLWVFNGNRRLVP